MIAYKNAIQTMAKKWKICLYAKLYILVSEMRSDGLLGDYYLKYITGEFRCDRECVLTQESTEFLLMGPFLEVLRELNKLV